MNRKEVEWEKDLGQKVRVYRNLINGLISVQHSIKGRGWILSGHCDNCVISEVSLQVSEAGRQRVLNDKKRNVHAYAAGRLISREPKDIYVPTKAIKIGYNPYKHGFFYDKRTGERIENNVKYLVVVDNEVYVEMNEKVKAKNEFKQIALEFVSLGRDSRQILMWKAA